MRYLFVYITYLLYLFVHVSDISAQGCSDAGICTVESFRPQTIQLPENNELTLGLSYGAADNTISVMGIQLGYLRHWGEKFVTRIRVNGVNQSGNNISVFGAGDIFLTGEYNVTKRFGGTLGLKVPLTHSDRMKNDLPLPMDYQSSLGTLDLLAGIHYHLEKFSFFLALQQPMSQNKNEFLLDNWPVDTTVQFVSTNQFHRRGDLLVRISHPIFNDTKVAVTPSLQGVVHLGEDTYEVPGEGKVPIAGSSGLTINFNMTLAWKLARRDLMQLNVGFPVLVRKTRPDGLTRGFVAALDLKHAF